MCKSVYQSTSGRLSCGRTESSYFPSPSTNWPTTSRISPPACTPNPTRPAQASLLDLLDYVPRFPAPARPAPPRPQLYPAHYAASCTRRTPTTAGAPRTQDVLRNLRTQPIPPTSRNGTTHGTLRGLRSHGFGHFPQSPEYGDRFDNYYHRSRWGYDCLYCIDRSDRCHTVCPELTSCSYDYASDFRLPTTQHHAGSRDQTSPRRPNTSHSAHPLTRHGITGPVHVPIDRLEADHYYGSARSSLHHALAAMTFEQIHFGLNPVSLALLVVPSRPARSHHISTPYTAMTIVGDTSDPQGSHQHGGFGCACLRPIMGC
jgi:hypothetical protein